MEVSDSSNGLPITHLQSVNKGTLKRLYFASLKNQVLSFEDTANLIPLDGKRRIVSTTEKEKIRGDNQPTVVLQFELVKSDGSPIVLSSNTIINGQICEEPAFYVHLLNGFESQSFDEMIPFVILSFNYAPTAFGTPYYILRIKSTGAVNAQTELMVEFRKSSKRAKQQESEEDVRKIAKSNILPPGSDEHSPNYTPSIASLWDTSTSNIISAAKLQPTQGPSQQRIEISATFVSWLPTEMCKIYWNRTCVMTFDPKYTGGFVSFLAPYGEPGSVAKVKLEYGQYRSSTLLYSYLGTTKQNASSISQTVSEDPDLDELFDIPFLLTDQMTPVSEDSQITIANVDNRVAKLRGLIENTFASEHGSFIKSADKSVILMGPTGHGKSVLINSLIGCEVLPFAEKATCFPVTYYSTKLKIDGFSIKVKYHQRSEVEHHLLHKDDTAKFFEQFSDHDVQSITVELNSPLLSSGIQLIDLPGFNETQEDFSQIIEKVKLSDLFFFVQNGSQPLSKNSMNLLSKLKDKFGENFIKERGLTFLTHLDSSPQQANECINKAIEEMRKYGFSLNNIMAGCPMYDLLQRMSEQGTLSKNKELKLVCIRERIEKLPFLSGQTDKARETLLRKVNKFKRSC